MNRSRLALARVDNVPFITKSASPMTQMRVGRKCTSLATLPPRSETAATATGPATTALGASGFGRNPLSDLYLLSVSNLVTTEMFHEAADPRNERVARLFGV